ncbi:ceramide synthase 2 isoform X1 [Scleropages formosus]|uniref:ceramide synthase 2 isoform X1 n=1 Tax=Scleropages formosus TaxID=113540 RepID=UPI000878EBB9|nr:ceramide synthase 3 isoform X1 [Scleropages formosus]
MSYCRRRPSVISMVCCVPADRWKAPACRIDECRVRVFVGHQCTVHSCGVLATGYTRWSQVPSAFILHRLPPHFRFVATPVAASFGIGDKIRQKAPDNVILEKYFCSCSRNPTQLDIDGLSKKCIWTRRQVERWFRKRRNQDRPGLLKKFREASWRFVFYLLAFIGGLIALYDKPWFYSTREVWVGFPKQTMLESQYWYYILEMSFYVSLLFSITFDVKRKDFKEQIIHHLATLTLLAFSWCVNYIRIGSLVMITHDASDVLLESAKLFNYAKWETTCNSIFVVFAIVFMVTRLIIFPFWLIHCTWVYPVEMYPAFFGYYFFNAMLVVLLLLHIFWAYLILRMVRKFLFGNLTGDERSDEEEEDEEGASNATEEEEEARQKVSNGAGTRALNGTRSLQATAPAY